MRAVAIHGITNEFLEDKPKFFEKADEIMSFLNDSEVISSLMARRNLNSFCSWGIIDSLDEAIFEIIVRSIKDEIQDIILLFTYAA